MAGDNALHRMLRQSLLATVALGLLQGCGKPVPVPKGTPEDVSEEARPDTTINTRTQAADGASETGASKGIGVEGGSPGAYAPWYLVQLHDHISANWQPPSAIGRTGEVQARVHFVLMADGSVEQAEVTESSGHRLFDMSVMRAILNSQPLPPIPEDLDEASLGLTLTFQKKY